MAPSVNLDMSLKQASPYEDQPLKPGQIRLLSVEWITEPSLQHVYPWISAARTLQLRTFVQTFGDDTEDYLAVSYVWGTAPASVRLMCNGAALFVTTNVYEMLVNLEPRRIFLWIDAICIDQDNPVEKATQIPLMHRVYTQTELVVVWLGASDPSINTFMGDFPRVFELAQDWDPKNHDRHDPYWRGREWPPDDDPFWYGLFHLASHTWFQRLWTFQEVVLAEEVHMIHGTSSIELGQLLSFWNGRFHGMRNYCYQFGGVVETLPDFFATIDIFTDACQTIRWGHGYRSAGGAGPYDLPTIFIYTRCRRVKEQVDRIWAIAGILQERLRNNLSAFVDYSEQARSQYWLTYIVFAKAVYEEEHALALLNIPPSAKHDEIHVPSWCPRFDATETLCDLVITWWWHWPVGRLEELTRRWLSIIEDEEDENDRQCEESRTSILHHPSKAIMMDGDENILNIRGFVLDVITEVVDGIGSLQRYGREYFRPNANFVDPALETVRGFYLKSLALAQRTVGSTNDAAYPIIPQEFIMCLFCDCRVNMEANRACQDLFATLTPEGSRRHTLLDEARQEAASVFWMNARSIIGHSFFATKGGRIGLATPGCRPGDKVCVFYGGEPLYILPAEGTGAGSKPVVFGGTAFIPHLMVQGERDAAKLGEDEIFALC